jgi:UDP-N-acetylglucosamine 1-carboxyvinyltransferase
MTLFLQNDKEKIYITGGYPLKGTVKTSGAKNAALPLMALSLILNKGLTLLNIPNLADTRLMSKLLIQLGININWTYDKVECNGHPKINEASYDLVRKMRASILVLGPLLTSFGSARVPLPGGCAIGARPIDLHLLVMESLGANIKYDSGFIIASIGSEGLKGSVIDFPKVSVGATESAIMTAVLAKGETKILNAAHEPEIIDLAKCLTSAGANIKGAGTGTIIINGVKKLNPVCHDIVPDRIEAGSFAIASAITKGNIEINNIRPNDLEFFLQILKFTGCEVNINKNSINVSSSKRPISYNITTESHPGFPTDLQAQYMALMSIADGNCYVKETIFENRFMHVPELLRMGANITTDNQTATIRGVKNLYASKVMASDLRASMSLILGALVASGTSEIDGIHHLDRGYEKIEDKLSNLGAIINRSK